MIRRAAAAALAALALGLGGCATPRPASDGGLWGRLVLKVEASGAQAARSFSTQFDLRGSAERGELQLTSPLGTTVAQARWQPGGAELTTSDGTTRYPDLDGLAQRMLGEPLPLAALIDWLHGRPWPGAPNQVSAAGAGFEQLGWSVSLARFDEGWVLAERSVPAPAVSVRARMERPAEPPRCAVKALLDVPAPAKLNLFLHVVGRRADGYHLLQSVFVLLDWCDILHFERRADGRLQRHDLGPALPEDDLSLRAARLLQRASGCSEGADLSVNKRVPWGAGLGGGSSDAATTLLALNRLWKLNWPRERLLPLAAQLGADVPFFIGGRTAFVEGVGDRLTPLELPAQRFAVVKPPAAIATVDIFSSPGLARDTPAVILAGFLADPQARASLTQGWGRNDLQGVAEARCPEVAEAAAWLHQRHGNSRMTGSGSAVFARIEQGADGLPVAMDSAVPPGWEGRMCRSLFRHPLAAWAG